MIAAVANGQPCWLLPYVPNRADSVRLGVKIPVDEVRALGGASSRRPEGIAPRYSLEWSADLRRADWAALRNATQSWQNEPVLAPVWPFAIRVGQDTAMITAGLVVAWTEGWATWAINPGSLVGYTYAAPLVFGVFANPPRSPGALNDDVVTVDFSVDEDSPNNCTLAPVAGLLPADTTFNTAGGYAAPVFPFVSDWSQAPLPGVAVAAVDRKEIGPSRRRRQSFYPQLPEQTQQSSFSFKSAAEAAKLIAWWIRRAGTADSQWVATSQTIGRLSAVAAAGQKVMNFTAPIALGANNYVAIFGPNDVLELGRVQSSGAQQITLVANLANAWAPSMANVATALLAHASHDELVIEFQRAGTGWIATSRLSWREVAAEVTLPAGETRGTTVGRLPSAAYFFQIDLDYNGAIESTYLTNWEAGAYANLINWTHNSCDFDRLVQSVDLEDDTCTFRVRWYAGCPWENWMTGRLAARGYLSIYRADVDNAGAFSNFRQVMKGEMGRPTREGADYTVPVRGSNALFARKGPRQLMIPQCGTNLFRPRCGLALGDWTFNAVIAAAAGNVVTIGTIVRANGGGAPSGFGATNWFALGWMGVVIAGLPRRYSVLSSAALAGGQIVLTLDRAPGLAVGSAVSAVPGCDRYWTTCLNKFANTDNHRGFDEMPSTSPSLVIPQRKFAASKK